ncbi:hypothetical protein KJ809_02945, partial [Patescibacteria group bacterium]|nr:hypothetical protein [Patescibacteria group bacterium]
KLFIKLKFNKSSTFICFYISMQELKKLYNKKIALLGLGIENYALVKYVLDKKINCEITICDARNEKE